MRTSKPQFGGPGVVFTLLASIALSCGGGSGGQTSTPSSTPLGATPTPGGTLAGTGIPTSGAGTPGGTPTPAGTATATSTPTPGGTGTGTPAPGQRYLDEDRDGYGGTVVLEVTDTRPGVLLGGDCNDSDATFYPGAIESVGDLQDFNCDNNVSFVLVYSTGVRAEVFIPSVGSLVLDIPANSVTTTARQGEESTTLTVKRSPLMDDQALLDQLNQSHALLSPIVEFQPPLQFSTEQPATLTMGFDNGFLAIQPEATCDWVHTYYLPDENPMEVEAQTTENCNLGTGTNSGSIRAILRHLSYYVVGGGTRFVVYAPASSSSCLANQCKVTVLSGEEAKMDWQFIVADKPVPSLNPIFGYSILQTNTNTRVNFSPTADWGKYINNYSFPHYLLPARVDLEGDTTKYSQVEVLIWSSGKQVLDRNQNGRLDTNESCEVLSSVVPNCSEAMEAQVGCGEATACCDVDRDGWPDLTDCYWIEVRPNQLNKDDDGDGYSENQGDCNDAEPSIYPTATESAGDEVDQNCDGKELCYVDFDRDGYRKAGDETVASQDLMCGNISPEATKSAKPGDCVDNDGAVNPGVSETTCNGKNDDCNSSTQDAPDADGDGFDICGKDTDGKEADCDDKSSKINPGKAEVCDGLNVDEDCDYQSDDADASTLVDSKSNWYTDSDGDGAGNPDTEVVKCDPTSSQVANDNDCDDKDDNTYEGASEICDNKDNNCDGTSDQCAGLTVWVEPFEPMSSDILECKFSVTSGAQTTLLSSYQWYMSLEGEESPISGQTLSTLQNPIGTDDIFTTGDTVRCEVTVTDKLTGAKDTSPSDFVTIGNSPPYLAPIPDQTTDEDKSIEVILSISDVETATGDLTVAATSDNQTLLSSASGVVVQPADGRWKLKLTPAKDQSGSATVTVEVNDGEAQDSVKFKLTVRAVNDLPTITCPTTATTNEDVATSWTCTVNDVETPIASLTTTCSVSPSNAGTCGIPGTSGSRKLSFTPAANWYGTATVTATVKDGDNGAGSAPTSVEVESVNDLPTISDLVTASTLEDVATSWSFTVNDVETPIASLTTTCSVSPSSAGTCSITGTGGSRTLSFTPAANWYGTATVTATVKDGDNGTGSAPISVEVKSVNDLPTITCPATASTPEDVATSWTCTVNDVETPIASLTTTCSVSPSNAGTCGIPGTSSSRTLSFIPALNWYGTATVTATVKDGDNGTGSAPISVEVKSVNDLPTITCPSTASTLEDVATSWSCTVNDVEPPIASLTTTCSVSPSSAGTCGIPGTGGSRTLSFTPAANWYGTATVTATVKDGDNGTGSAPTLVEVKSVNDLPTITCPSTASTLEDVATSWTCTVNDVETPIASLTTTCSVSPSSAGTCGIPGTGGSRTLSFTPAANWYGTATVTATVKDGDNGTGSAPTPVSVSAVLDAPVITCQSPSSLNEDTSTNWSCTVTDADSATSLVTNVSCTVSNTAIGSCTLTGTGDTRTVSYTAKANMNDAITVTVSVKDETLLTGSNISSITINPVNDPPTLTNITDKSTGEDVPLSNIAIYPGDVETAASALTLTCASSNTALLPIANCTVTNSSSGWKMSLQPAAGKSGQSTVTVTVSDPSGATVTDSFVLTVYNDGDEDSYSTNTDCDDGDYDINPGVGESCGDNIDNNCNGQVDENCCPMSTWYKDGDADGYGLTNSTTQACIQPTGYANKGGDCNDSAKTVYPGATETCNGIDDDCEGGIDEGVKSTYYLDGDKDGFGLTTSTTQACTLPSGYASQGGDCNDNNIAVNPGATETCNGIDDDCDSSRDEGVTTTYYLDMDGDSYGQSGVSTQACTLLIGYVSQGGDCDDTKPSVNPGALEVCDYLDNNCDQAIDEGTTKYYIQEWGCDPSGYHSWCNEADYTCDVDYYEDYTNCDYGIEGGEYASSSCTNKANWKHACECF